MRAVAAELARTNAQPHDRLITIHQVHGPLIGDIFINVHITVACLIGPSAGIRGACAHTEIVHRRCALMRYDRCKGFYQFDVDAGEGIVSSGLNVSVDSVNVSVMAGADVLVMSA